MMIYTTTILPSMCYYHLYACLTVMSEVSSLVFSFRSMCIYGYTDFPQSSQRMVLCNNIPINKTATMSLAFEDQQKVAEQAKNAKILSRKQIEKRLQGLKPEEYERICSNLRSQNEKLKVEVKNLSEKVQELVQSRKVSKQKNPQIQQELARLKRELDVKYESMGHLKQQLAKAKQSDMTEEMRMKIKEHSNIVSKCHKELRELQVEREDLRSLIEKNEADLQEFIPTNHTDVKMDAIKIENRELRSKITKMKEELTAQERSSKTVINKIYELKGQEKQRALAKSTYSISASLKELKSGSLNEITALQKEIEQLRVRKQNMEKDLVTDKIIKQTKKGRLQREIKQRLQAHKQLYKRRVKGVNQLNLYQHKESMLKQQLQREAEIAANIKVYNEGQAQTDQVVQQEYRKESIGKSEGLLFSDAEMLQDRACMLVKGVTVYKSPESIVFTKFHYESPQGKKFESQPPFDRFILKKCQAKKYESKSQAGLAGLVVSVHPQTKRVVRFELKWLDGDSSVIGWQVEGSVRYPFDICNNERPVCMFGSVETVGKYAYVLESLGCEINQKEL